MPNSNAWIAISAAIVVSAISLSSALAIFDPSPLSHWGPVVVTGAFTALGLVGAAWITFQAAERSARPVRAQIFAAELIRLKGEVRDIEESLQALDSIVEKISMLEKQLGRFRLNERQMFRNLKPESFRLPALTSALAASIESLNNAINVYEICRSELSKTLDACSDEPAKRQTYELLTLAHEARRALVAARNECTRAISKTQNEIDKNM